LQTEFLGALCELSKVVSELPAGQLDRRVPVTGADILMGLFPETRSPAARLLDKHRRIPGAGSRRLRAGGWLGRLIRGRRELVVQAPCRTRGSSFCGNGAQKLLLDISIRNT
jgi:hypothetical protein